MKPVKVALTGAGSAALGLGTLVSLLRSPRLRDCTLTLVDLKAEGLALVEALAHRLNREWDAGLMIESTTGGTEALPGADFHHLYRGWSMRAAGVSRA